VQKRKSKPQCEQRKRVEKGQKIARSTTQIAVFQFASDNNLFLLIDQTKSLFQRWLLYGIGTMFSMGVLSAMVSIALKMVTAVAEAFWATALAGSLLGSDFTDGMTSQAMQQGGMGLILTALIISAPPMAAMFFQGTLGQFMAFSQFGGGGGAVGHRPGESGYQGGYGSQSLAPQNNQQTPQALPTQTVSTRIAGATESSVDATVGQRGLANKGPMS